MPDMRSLLKAMGVGEDVVARTLREPMMNIAYQPQHERRGQHPGPGWDFVINQELNQMGINARKQAQARIGRESLTSHRQPYGTRRGPNPLLLGLIGSLLGSGIGALGFIGYQGAKRNDAARELERRREEEELLTDPDEANPWE